MKARQAHEFLAGKKGLFYVTNYNINDPTHGWFIKNMVEVPGSNGYWWEEKKLYGNIFSKTTNWMSSNEDKTHGCLFYEDDWKVYDLKQFKHMYKTISLGLLR